MHQFWETEGPDWEPLGPSDMNQSLTENSWNWRDTSTSIGEDSSLEMLEQ